MNEPNFEFGPEDGKEQLGKPEEALPLSKEVAREIVDRDKEALQHPLGERIHDQSLPRRPNLPDRLAAEKRLRETQDNPDSDT